MAFGKLPLVKAEVFEERAEAETCAESWRYQRYVVRVFRRQVSAGRAKIPVWCVVVRDREMKVST